MYQGQVSFNGFLQFRRKLSQKTNIKQYMFDLLFESLGDWSHSALS